MKLSGHTILITGGGSGIGLALAKTFLKAGNEVIIVGRDRAKLEAAVAQNPGLQLATCDIQNAASIAALCEQFRSRVNILINNAAISQAIVLTDQGSLERQVAEIEINLVGTIRMVNAFLPALTTKPVAAIVNVTSALAYVPSANSPVYSATKAALHSFTQSLRHQLRRTSVKVFELIPPLTDTPMAARMSGVPKLAPQVVVDALMAAMAKDELEITPGLTRAAKFMSRLAPRYAFSLLNKK